MWMLLWKNITRRRTQSALTIAITLLTVMSFVLVLGVFQTADRGLALSRERMGADAVLVPKYSSADSGDLLFTAIPENIYMSAETLAQAKQLDGVAALTPQFYAQTLALSCCDPGEEARIIGIDPDSDFILRPYLADSSKDTLAYDELIMGSEFEDDDLLGYNYLILGKKCKVVNLLQPTGTGMDRTIFLAMDMVRQMCLDSEVLSVDWTDKDPYAYISVIMIKLDDGVDPETFAAAVEQSGIDAKCLLTGDTISALQEQLLTMKKIIFVLWLASLLIAALALLGRFNALVKGRKKEIGLLRALGLKKRKVFVLVIGETCTMAFIGGVLGSAAALLAAKPVIEILKDTFRLSASVWSEKAAILCASAGILLALLLGCIAALIPAAQSAGMDPQAAITQGEAN